VLSLRSVNTRGTNLPGTIEASRITHRRSYLTLRHNSRSSQTSTRLRAWGDLQTEAWKMGKALAVHKLCPLFP